MCIALFARSLRFCLGLALCGGPLAALEIEDQRLYPGTGSETISVLSTADLDVFEPFILQFQAEQPQVGIDYHVASSTQIHAAIKDGAAYDLAISSAMDLQFQLANDGVAQSYVSPVTENLPAWARWRDQVFAFTAEPAVTVISPSRFAGLPRPQTRQELIALLRQNPDVFQNAIGTYDVRTSGLGYLFATQEARNSDTFWRLSELMGGQGAALYCCSAQMIDDVAAGELALAYNVLGSYAAERIARDDRLEVLELEDYATVMLRTALIPATATNQEGAALFLDRLLQEGMRDTPASWVLPPLGAADKPEARAFGPIRLGPALLVYLDKLNRGAFLRAWSDAMVQ
jgi:iron(III) transport system substrate-binding protein